MLAAAICLLEVLKPISKSVYKARLYGKRQADVSAAAANYVDDYLDLDDLHEDAW